MAYPFRNLVFEGGGVKGSAYIGAIRALNEEGILPEIQRFGGTSAGAITALLLGLSIPFADLVKIHKDMNFKAFKDDDFSIVQDNIRLFFDGFGIYKGDFFTEWVGKIVEKWTGSKDTTFQQLYDKTGKDVFFQGTNISTHQLRTFSRETTPDVPLVVAVRISMSIPFFFKSVEWDKDYYVDGGVLDNYPIRLFDRKSFVNKEEHFTTTDTIDEVNKLVSNTEDHSTLRSLHTKYNASFFDPADEIVYNKETLGFRLESQAEIAMLKHIATSTEHHIGHSLIHFAWNLSQTMIKGHESGKTTKEDAARTVFINTFFTPSFNFDITEEEKKTLMNSVYTSTKDYLHQFNTSEVKLFNRP
ncbi:patatin-like phospholipase family protein [Bacillus cereus]|uniref:patatin-like phospholipase family protein n=1 Tax=Bacillus cereus TaxID=1396 RepID=UPI0024058D44|nr:patatin-like phospholipase family protein [Bacillus cereus]MDF9468366.1 patatin-like phospholipase family protein [Bacillus cereus]